MNSCDMSPFSPFDDKVDCGHIHSVLLSKREKGNLSRNISSANFSNLIFRKNCSPVHRSACSPFRKFLHKRISISPLSDHVVHIFLVISQEKVIRIHARSVVALVKCMQIIGNWSKRDCPRYAMRSISNVSDTYVSIPIPLFSCGPIPASSDRLEFRSIFIYFRPKSFLFFFREFGDLSCSHIAKSISWLVSVIRWLIPTDNAQNLTYIFA